MSSLVQCYIANHCPLDLCLKLFIYCYRFLFFFIFKFICNSNYKSLWTSLMRNKVNQPSLKFKTKPLEFVISYAPYSNSSLNFFPYSCASCLKAKTTLSVSGPSSSSEQLWNRKQKHVIFLITYQTTRIVKGHWIVYITHDKKATLSFKLWGFVMEGN